MKMNTEILIWQFGTSQKSCYYEHGRERKCRIVGYNDKGYNGLDNVAYHTWMKTIFNLILILGLAVFAVRAQAQDQVPPPMPAGQTFTDAQLQQLLGPIALYPDPLIAVMLPAATLPTQIVMADRYVSGGGDPNQINQQPWDPNVQALANYPAILKWMDDNLNWTTQLGEAFQNQQNDVMNAVQELRTQAYNLGNLQSTPQQQVVDDNGYIEIIPADPNSLYVPQYQPDQVYYDQAGVTPYITYGGAFVIGPWLCGDFDWRNHHLVYWDRDHPRPAGWWHQAPRFRADYLSSGRVGVWNSANRPGFVRSYGGDRGYNNNLPWTAPQANFRAPAPGQAERQNAERQNAERQNVEHQNAFIGIQSTHDTQNFSQRGERSMETMPQFHNLGGFHGGGGGGGYHGGGAPAGGGGGRR